MMSIILEKKSIYKNKKKFINFLEKKGIQVRSIWFPNHLQKPFRNYQKYQIKNAREIFKKTINIPCSTNLKISDAKKVVQIIKKFITIHK